MFYEILNWQITQGMFEKKFKYVNQKKREYIKTKSLNRNKRNKGSTKFQKTLTTSLTNTRVFVPPINVTKLVPTTI